MCKCAMPALRAIEVFHRAARGVASHPGVLESEPIANRHVNLARFLSKEAAEYAVIFARGMVISFWVSNTPAFKNGRFKAGSNLEPRTEVVCGTTVTNARTCRPGSTLTTTQGPHSQEQSATPVCGQGRALSSCWSSSANWPTAIAVSPSSEIELPSNVGDRRRISIAIRCCSDSLSALIAVSNFCAAAGKIKRLPLALICFAARFSEATIGASRQRRHLLSCGISA